MDERERREREDRRGKERRSSTSDLVVTQIDTFEGDEVTEFTGNVAL